MLLLQYFKIFWIYHLWHRQLIACILEYMNYKITKRDVEEIWKVFLS